MKTLDMFLSDLGVAKDILLSKKLFKKIEKLKGLQAAAVRRTERIDALLSEEKDQTSRPLIIDAGRDCVELLACWDESCKKSVAKNLESPTYSGLVIGRNAEKTDAFCRVVDARGMRCPTFKPHAELVEENEEALENSETFIGLIEVYIPNDYKEAMFMAYDAFIDEERKGCVHEKDENSEANESS